MHYNRRMTECPNCGAPRAGGAEDCPKCRVIFSKWKAREERREEKTSSATPPPAIKPPASPRARAALFWVSLTACVGAFGFVAGTILGMPRGSSEKAAAPGLPEKRAPIRLVRNFGTGKARPAPAEESAPGAGRGGGTPASAGETGGAAGVTSGAAGVTGGAAGVTGGAAGVTSGAAGVTSGDAGTAGGLAGKTGEAAGVTKEKPKNPCVIKGMVLDLVTLLPVRNAAVSFGKSKTATDANGRYSIKVRSKRSRCTHRAALSHPDYHPELWWEGTYAGLDLVQRMRMTVSPPLRGWTVAETKKPKTLNFSMFPKPEKLSPADRALYRDTFGE